MGLASFQKIWNSLELWARGVAGHSATATDVVPVAGTAGNRALTSAVTPIVTLRRAARSPALLLRRLRLLWRGRRLRERVWGVGSADTERVARRPA